MKRSHALSLAVALLSFAIVAGCDGQGSPGKGGNSGSTQGQGGSGKNKVQSPGDPPGLAPGLVEIYKTDLNGQDVHIGYVAATSQGEAWLLKNPHTYPVQLMTNEWLKFKYLGPIPLAMDSSPQDGIVTTAELCASPLVLSCKPGKLWTVAETSTFDGDCP